VSRAEVPEVIGRILETYVELREPHETFLDTCRRVGAEPFKERIYVSSH
jgi:sulfite reductase (NADPH) hemoprotein beta-component